jgi:protein-disulfide isomerase
MDKRFWAIIGVIVVVFGGMLFFNNHQEKTPTATAGVTSHYKGSLNSKVTLTEYGDYQCSACYKFQPATKQVEEKYAATVRFQFRNLPLQSLHPNAFAGARAAEAADMQGKFWQMHDMLYQNQDPTGASGWVASKNPLGDYFVQFAQQIGLNVAKFKTDFASSAVNDRINADMDAFKATGEDMSTPTYFLNGKKIDNAKLLDSAGQPSADAFSKVIDEALK